jgi:hypothetical protein
VAIEEELFVAVGSAPNNPWLPLIVYRGALQAGAEAAKLSLEAAPGVNDVSAIAEQSVPGLREAAGLDNIAGAAHRVGVKLLGEPIMADALRLTIVIGCHHRISRNAKGEGRGRVRGKTLDANPVVVDDAAGERDEAG